MPPLLFVRANNMLKRLLVFHCVLAVIFFWAPLSGFGASVQDRAQASLAPVWSSLEMRLARDGVSGPEVSALLSLLPPTPTQSPMGRKMRELYRRQFMPGTLPKISADTYYKGVVSEENARLCRAYIREHQAAFDSAYERYGVPPSIASALLFVETRLGKVLADVPENAFYILASMAVCDSPEDISEWLPRLPGYAKHMDWMRQTMRKRSDWAYTEIRALVRHMIRDNIPPHRLPGSIYGAVGLCQFMPSNIGPYGADGDGDGRIDLFTPADAIASLANYLAKHGWKKNLGREQMHRLLMSYNHSKVYANTILALSALVDKPAASGTAKSKKAVKKP